MLKLADHDGLPRELGRPSADTIGGSLKPVPRGTATLLPSRALPGGED